MNLIIDQGNTICKIAVYEQKQCLYSIAVDALDEEILSQLFARYNSIDALIYSSVGVQRELGFAELVEQVSYRLCLDATTPVPVEVAYERTSLGADRLAGVVGAYALSGGACPCLVVDAGTAVTYEYIAEGGRYLGGNISPGLWLRFKALNSFTSRLPLIKDLPDGPIRSYGQETTGAMTSGCVLGLERELRAYIQEARMRDPRTEVYLTGGDGGFLSERLADLELHYEPELVLLGLTEILEYNKKNYNK